MKLAQGTIEHLARMNSVFVRPIVQVIDKGFAEVERDFDFAGFTGRRLCLATFGAATLSKATMLGALCLARRVVCIDRLHPLPYHWRLLRLGRGNAAHDVGCCSPRLRRPGPLDPGPARHRLGEGARTPRGRPSPQPPVGGGRSRPAVAPGPPAQADGSATKSRPSPGSRSRFTFPGLGRAIIFFRITVRSPNWRRQGHQQLRPISTTPES
jgi:hypothetical protein